MYRTLVMMGTAEVTDLAHRLALPGEDVERALRHLESQGLAQPSARTGRWDAAPPGVALYALLTQRRHRLAQAELAAASLARRYRTAAAKPAAHDLVEVVTGTRAVTHRFLQLQLGAVEGLRPRHGQAGRGLRPRERGGGAGRGAGGAIGWSSSRRS